MGHHEFILLIVSTVSIVLFWILANLATAIITSTPYYIVHMATISARLSDSEKEALDEVAVLLDEDRSTTIRKALSEGLTNLRVHVAIERYQSGEISVKQAAEIADVSLGKWLSIARENNLTSQLSPEELESDVEAARDL